MTALLLFAYAASFSTPRNLDFSEGRPGTAPLGWAVSESSRAAGYSAGWRNHCADDLVCGVLIPPASHSASALDGELLQSIDATPYRGKTFILRGQLRPAASGTRVRLIARVIRSHSPLSPLDNSGGEAVRTPEWTDKELSVPVAADAQTIEFGIASSGPGEAWLRNVSVGTPGQIQNRVPVPPMPVNLTFTEGASGGFPNGWTLVTEGPPAGPPPVELSTEACETEDICAIVRGGASLRQTFDAKPWKQSTLVLSAVIKVESESGGVARLWVQMDGPADSSGARSRRTAYKDVQAGDAAKVEVPAQITDSADIIGIGLTFYGKGSATVEAVTAAADKFPPSR